MDTGKVYFDSEGNEYSIWQMVKREPTWAAVRIQEGEKAIDEITTLRQQLANAKEENEQVRQANLDVMMHFEDMKAAKEKAEARVAEHEEEMELFTAAAVMICQQESDEWDSDSLQTYKDYAELCGQRIAKLTPVNAKSWLRRKQAEAVELMCAEWKDEAKWIINQRHANYQRYYAKAGNDYAQRLRQQADEAERAGGEK